MRFSGSKYTDMAAVKRSMGVLLVAVSILLSSVNLSAQSPDPVFKSVVGSGENNISSTGFRVEKVAVAGGSEIVTIFARQRPGETNIGPVNDLPLVSVLRDTLGDDIPENDRLRYVWMLSYTNPSLRQKAAGAIPFFYSRTRNKTDVGTKPPPPVIDLSTVDKAVWGQAFWEIFKRISLSDLGTGLRAPALQYKQNSTDYRRTALAAAITVLSLYQDTTGEKVLADSEMHDIQARMFLSDKMLGWHMQSENLGRVYEKETTLVRDYRGHNWELLRQYTEAQGLYFDPIEMPDGSARHAIVWVSASDVKANKGKKFDRRFLNFKSPWDDDRLLNWKGYAQVRWYDAEDREVDSETPGARPRTLIPLAVYGLDHPKVPVILVDFRDINNPKVREISKRILNDLTGNVLSLSALGGMPFFVGRFIYDFVTGRRGLDFNGATRQRAYSQLKLLVSLDASLDPEFRNEIAERVEAASINPLQNDVDVELKLARDQYVNLMAWAQREDGLPKRIADDRREEMSRLKHKATARAMFDLGHFFSFGRYTHRETPTPELIAQLDIRRQLDHHERFLREVAFSSAEPRIDTDVDRLRRSMNFVARQGGPAQEKTARALAKIFAISKDPEIQNLALAGLYRIDNSTAKKQLLAVYKNQDVADRWRDICAEYLKLALQEGQRISKSDAQTISAIAAN